MTLQLDQWLHLPGVPESTLSDEVRGRLAAGEGGPPEPPPWSTRVEAVLWWHRARAVAPEVLSPALRGLPTLPLTVAALVRYLDSPVGSYVEVFASPVLVRRGPVPAISVPFIAVDSIASVAGGRAGWALPKSLVEAQWPSPEDIAVSGATPDGAPFSVRASAPARGPALPLAGVLPLLQPQPDGSLRRSTVTMRGRARVARVEVGVRGPSLPEWLPSGRYPALRVEAGRMRISKPRP